MMSKLKTLIRNKFRYINQIPQIAHYIQNDYKSPKVNLGQIQSAANKYKKGIKNLADVEFQVFSQFGDDGIIQWLINELPIPNKTFIEFGVENYKEANTRFLLINNYWSGLVIDGSIENVNSIKSEQIYNFYDLQASCSFITKSNINELITSARFDKEIGILSVDIDGNDYWILKEINRVQPVIIICEYNSLFGYEHPYTINYKDDFVRGNDYPFSFYGSSLRSAIDLTEKKGYGFIGCNSAGNNAYFIKNDYIKYLSIPIVSAKEGYVFSSFTEAWDKEGTPLRGMDKIRAIHHLPVINTDTGEIERVDAEAIINSLQEAKKMKRF